MICSSRIEAITIPSITKVIFIIQTTINNTTRKIIRIIKSQKTVLIPTIKTIIRTPTLRKVPIILLTRRITVSIKITATFTSIKRKTKTPLFPHTIPWKIPITGPSKPRTILPDGFTWPFLKLNIFTKFLISLLHSITYSYFYNC